MSLQFFSGSWVLITGASSGIGEAFAYELAHRGANLILTARSEERLTRLAKDLSCINGVQVHAIPCDLSAPDGALELAREIEKRGMFVAHVINNAGFGSAGAFEDSDPAQQARMVRVNTEAVVTLSRYFLPAMRARGAGGIINVASTAGHQPMPYMATYGATKAFVLSFSIALHAELERSPVRVMACCPGPVPTGFQAIAGVPSTGILRLASIDRMTVVRRTLDAYIARRAVYTPGFLNALQVLISKIMPRALMVQATGVAMKRLGRA